MIHHKDPQDSIAAYILTEIYYSKGYRAKVAGKRYAHMESRDIQHRLPMSFLVQILLMWGHIGVLFLSPLTLRTCVGCLPREACLSQIWRLLWAAGHLGISCYVCNHYGNQHSTLTMKLDPHCWSWCLCESTWEAHMVWSIDAGVYNKPIYQQHEDHSKGCQGFIMGPLKMCKEQATRPAVLTLSSQSVFSKMSVINLYYFYNEKSSY